MRMFLACFQAASQAGSGGNAVTCSEQCSQPAPEMLFFIIRQNLNESSAAAEMREDQVPLPRSCYLCCLGSPSLHILASHLLGDVQTLHWGRVGPVSSRPFPTCPILHPPQVLSMKRLKTPANKRDIPSKYLCPAMSSEIFPLPQVPLLLPCQFYFL